MNARMTSLARREGAVLFVVIAILCVLAALAVLLARTTQVENQAATQKRSPIFEG